MGQKTHPIGLRVGTLIRPWNSTWYSPKQRYQAPLFNQFQIEEFLKSLLNLYSYTKVSATNRALLVDAKLFKYGARQLFIFVFFYKFRTKKRKEIKQIKGVILNKQSPWRFYSKTSAERFKRNHHKTQI